MILAAAVLAATASEPSLAFVARFYKPGTEKSRFELYVSDLQGKNRQLLTSTEEPNFVQWVGRDRLAWTTDTGLWTSKLSPWKPVRVLNSKSLSFTESRMRSTAPGAPEVELQNSETVTTYQINAATGKVTEASRAMLHDEIMLSEDSPVTIDNPSSPDHPLKLQKFQGFEYWTEGRMESSESEPVRAWNTDNNSKLWLLIGTHDSTSGAVNGAMVFEKDKPAKVLFDGANCFDLWPSRSLFAYCTSRTTSQLDGKRQVWTSELHVGDWKKGSHWPVVKGLVWVPSVSLRP